MSNVIASDRQIAGDMSFCLRRRVEFAWLGWVRDCCRFGREGVEEYEGLRAVEGPGWSRGRRHIEEREWRKELGGEKVVVERRPERR